MKDSNGNNITEEEFTKDIGHGVEDFNSEPSREYSIPSVTYTQPEEWESRFDGNLEDLKK